MMSPLILAKYYAFPQYFFEWKRGLKENTQSLSLLHSHHGAKGYEVAKNSVNPLQHNVPFSYPPKMFSGSIEKDRWANK